MNPDLLRQLPTDLFPGVIYIYDLVDEGNFYMNTKFEEILGYDRGEMKDLGAQVIASLIHPEDKERVDKVIELLSKSPPGRAVRTEYRLRDKNGEWRWFADSACVCATDEHGNMTQIVGTALEVTETHEANEAYDRMYKLFQLIIDVVPLAVCWKDVKGGYLGYNRNFLLGAGVSSDTSIVGKTDFELPWKDSHAQAFREIEAKIVATGKPDRNRLEEYPRENAPPLVFRAQRVPIHDGDEVIGVACIHEDVTDSIVLPKALEAMEQRYLFMTQTASFGVFIVDCEQHTVFEVNPRAAELLQRAPDQLLKQDFIEFFTAESQQALRAWLADLQESESSETEGHFELLGAESAENDASPAPLSVALHACVVKIENRYVYRIDMRPVAESKAKEAPVQVDTEAFEKSQQHLVTVQTALDSANRRILELEAQVTELEQAKASLETICTEQDKTLRTQADNYGALENQHAELKTAHENFKKQCQSLEKECSHLREAKDALAKQVESTAQDSEDAALIDDLESRIEELTAAQADLEAQLKSEKLAADSADQLLQKLNREKADLETRLAHAEKSLKHTQQDTDAARARAETQIADLTAELDKNRSALAQAQAERKQLKDAVESTRQQQEATHAQQLQTIKELERSLLSAQSQNDAQSREQRQKLEQMREQVAVVADLEARLPIPRLALDRDCQITDWNEPARQLFGYLREEVLGESVLRLIIPRRERPKFRGFLETVCDKCTIRNTQFENVNEKRDTLQCQWFFSPKIGADRQVIGIDAFVIDMSPVYKPAPLSEPAAERIRSPFERHTLPMCVLDAQSLRFCETNAAAARFYRCSERALLRRQFHEFSAGEKNLDTLSRLFEVHAGAEPHPFVLDQKLEDNTPRTVEIFASPTWDDANRKFYVLIIQDITDRSGTERTLRLSEERHRLALEGTRDGLLDWNLSTQHLSVSPALKTLLGYEPDAAWRTIDDFYKLVHLEDLGRLREQVAQAIALKRPILDVDLRLRSKAGDYRWMRCRAQGIRDDRTEPPALSRIIGTLSDITYLKSALEQLEEAFRELDSARQSSNLFLANMSHELRTPLNAVLGFCELLRDSELNDDQRDYVERVWQSSYALLYILNDVRDLTRIETDTMELEPSFIDARSFVEEVVGAYQRDAEMRSIFLHYTCDDSVPNSFEVDPIRLKQILENLISNALKFTEFGRVHVEMFAEQRIGNEATIGIRVSDTGCGISEEEQEKIFRLFTHTDTALVRKYGGAGLGLTLCERLATLMHGTLELESAVGRGSNFTVKLRLPVSDSPAFISARAGDNPFRKPARDKRSLSVLLIEDSPLHQDVVSVLLEKMGHIPTVVYNTDDAHILLEDEPYDVILMDLELPGTPPLEFVKRLQTRFFASGRPYIIAMAHTISERLKKNCLTAGVNECITTPLRREVLERALNAVPPHG